MSEIAVDVPSATEALDRGRAEVEGAADQAQSQEPQNTDPKVAELLRLLSDQTSGAAGRAEEHTTTGAAAAEGLTATDAESASAVTAAPMAGTSSSPSSRVSSATLGPSNISASQQQSSLAQQQAQQVMAQQAAAQQQQMAAAAQQQQMAAAQRAAAVAAPIASLGGMPAGTILVDPNDLARLVDSVAGSSSSSAGGSTGSVWTGSTAPEPIDVNDVQYNKTHGPLSKGEVSAVIESALDKTGIEDPAARAKWKFVLEYMSESESGNDPSAVNNSDSNAVGATQVDGSPRQSSRGQWQTIPTTFAEYHAAGTSTNIYDPEASAGAAINYMKDRYDIGDDGSGLDEFYAARAHGRYVGY